MSEGWSPGDIIGAIEDLNVVNVAESDVSSMGVYSDSTVSYYVYYFSGEVSSESGLIEASESMWTETTYGIDSAESSFATSYNTDYVSQTTIEGLVEPVVTAGMTPMLARVTVNREGGTDHSPHAPLNLQITAGARRTNESLYAFASDGQIYPMVDDATHYSTYYTYNLSDEEEESLRAQYDLSGETDYESTGDNWGGRYGQQFSSYLEELGQDLLNYMGTLLEPVINFNKTKNRKITDRQISSLGSMDTAATQITISTESTVEYTS